MGGGGRGTTFPGPCASQFRRGLRIYKYVGCSLLGWAGGGGGLKRGRRGGEGVMRRLVRGKEGGEGFSTALYLSTFEHGRLIRSCARRILQPFPHPTSSTGRGGNQRQGQEDDPDGLSPAPLKTRHGRLLDRHMGPSPRVFPRRRAPLPSSFEKAFRRGRASYPHRTGTFLFSPPVSP